MSVKVVVVLELLKPCTS